MALNPRIRLSQQSGHRLQTAPALEPLSLSYLKSLIRTPPPEEDVFVNSCIEQARRMFEGATGISCITQVWKMTLDRWPAQGDPWWDGVREMPVSELYASGRGPAHIDMPRYPLQSVDTINTYDEGDVATSLTVSSVFYTDTESFPGRLSLRSGQTWPVALRDTNAIEITYTSGFGDTPATVPAEIKRAIGNAAAFLYENRGTGCSAGAVLSASGALQIAAEYINVRI